MTTSLFESALQVPTVPDARTQAAGLQAAGALPRAWYRAINVARFTPANTPFPELLRQWGEEIQVSRATHHGTRQLKEHRL